MLTLDRKYSRSDSTDVLDKQIQHVLLVMSALSFFASEWRTISTLPALLLTLTYFKF